MRKILALAAVAAGLTIWSTSAQAWSPPSLTVEGNGCEHAVVTAHNPEGQPAKITAQTGGVFQVGQTIPSHGELSKPASGTGNLVVSITVDFPDNAQASTVVHFDDCPPPTTLPPGCYHWSGYPEDWTCPPDTTPPPDETTPPTTPHTMNPGPPPEDTPTQPKFTG